MSVFVSRLPTDPVVATKLKVNADDIKNPALPPCKDKFWIVDGDIVREMTQAEKIDRGLMQPPPDPKEQAAADAKAVLEQGDAKFAALGLEDFIKFLVAKGTIREGEFEAFSTQFKDRLEAREAARATVAAAAKP